MNGEIIQGRTVALPGRRIDELLGPLTRHEQHPRRHESHRRRQPGREVYVNDQRPGSEYRSRHEPRGSGIWVTHYAHRLHPDVLEAWERFMGPATSDEFGLASLKVISWDDEWTGEDTHTPWVLEDRISGELVAEIRRSAPTAVSGYRWVRFWEVVRLHRAGQLPPGASAVAESGQRIVHPCSGDGCLCQAYYRGSHWARRMAVDLVWAARRHHVAKVRERQDSSSIRRTVHAHDPLTCACCQGAEARMRRVAEAAYRLGAQDMRRRAVRCCEATCAEHEFDHHADHARARILGLDPAAVEPDWTGMIRTALEGDA